MCAALALVPFYATGAGAQAAPASNPGAAPSGGDANNSVATDPAITALRQGSTSQQGVPVPHSAPRARRHIDVNINASAGYDSNVLRRNALRPVTGRETKGDMLFPISTSVDILVPSGASVYSLKGTVGYRFYKNNTSKNSENIALLGGFQRQIRACQAGLDARFSRSRTQFEDGGIDLNDNNLQTTEGLGASLSCSVSVGLRPFGSFNYLRARNSDPRRSYSDHDTKTFGGGILDTIPSIGEVGIVASVENTDYTNRDPLFTQGATNLRVKSIGVSFNRATARILQARIQVNYTSVDDGRPNGSFHGISGDAVIRYVPGGRVEFTLRADRAAKPSLTFNSDYDLTTSYGLNVATKISARANVRVGYSHQDRKYFGVVAAPGLGFSNDATQTYSAYLNYKVLPKVSLFLSADHIKRTANNARLNYNDTRVTAGASLRL